MLRHTASDAAELKEELGLLRISGKTYKIAGPEGGIAVRNDSVSVTPYGAYQSF